MAHWAQRPGGTAEIIARRFNAEIVCEQDSSPGTTDPNSVGTRKGTGERRPGSPSVTAPTRKPDPQPAFP